MNRPEFNQERRSIFAAGSYMLFYTETISPRLQYIIDFAVREMGMDAWKLTTDKNELLEYGGPRITYTPERIINEGYWIKPHGLLSETGIRQQHITCFSYRDNKAFFKTGGDLPFDVFAASFYLLSRYEEYLPYQKDLYGRYPHDQSIAWKERFLDIPLVNYWLLYLAEELTARFPQMLTKRARFTYIPTYDIDEAFCYKHKSWFRRVGGAFRNIIKAQWEELRLRRAVTRGQTNDPFDAFARMHELNGINDLRPVYFFLVAKQTGRYDRHIPPSHPAMKKLIIEQASKYRIGLHPSWQSGDKPHLLKLEINILEKIADIRLIASRQHFIRLTIPETYRRIAEAGIMEDYSMGYGSVNGFRASVASPFFWYDLAREKASSLLLYPFCFMDANSYFEQKQTPDAALQEMRHYYQVVRRIDGVLITIWHNTFLGTAERFSGWGEVYAKFLEEINLEIS